MARQPRFERLHALPELDRIPLVAIVSFGLFALTMVAAQTPKLQTLEDALMTCFGSVATPPCGGLLDLAAWAPVLSALRAMRNATDEFPNAALLCAETARRIPRARDPVEVHLLIEARRIADCPALAVLPASLLNLLASGMRNSNGPFASMFHCTKAILMWCTSQTPTACDYLDFSWAAERAMAIARRSFSVTNFTFVSDFGLAVHLLQSLVAGGGLNSSLLSSARDELDRISSAPSARRIMSLIGDEGVFVVPSDVDAAETDNVQSLAAANGILFGALSNVSFTSSQSIPFLELFHAFVASAASMLWRALDANPSNRIDLSTALPDAATALLALQGIQGLTSRVQCALAPPSSSGAASLRVHSSVASDPHPPHEARFYHSADGLPLLAHTFQPPPALPPALASISISAGIAVLGLVFAAKLTASLELRRLMFDHVIFLALLLQSFLFISMYWMSALSLIATTLSLTLSVAIFQFAFLARQSLWRTRDA